MSQTIVIPKGTQIYLTPVIFIASAASCGALESSMTGK
jgi:hypothetical protein